VLPNRGKIISKLDVKRTPPFRSGVREECRRRVAIVDISNYKTFKRSEV
jgi:hypothetical protein